MNNAQPLQGQALADALLRPRSIALVGASDDAAKTAGRPLRFLRDAGYSGRIYPINAKRETVQGERAYPSLAALPEVPEHVYVLTPTDAVAAVVDEAARLGVPMLTILAGGFSEAGADGAALEVALQSRARSAGMRLLGPNSLGVVNPGNGLLLTANAAFAEQGLPQGRLFVASQSGSMLGALVSRGKGRGVGFAGLVSLGSEADLSIGEVCAATLDDPGIDGYLLFLESLHHGDRLRAFALEAARRGKPVLAYKLGRSAAAAEMSATHTGALAGEDDVADAFLKDLGIARLGVADSMLEAFPLALRIPLHGPLQTRHPGPLRVGVVTTTGGGAAMSVDQLGIRDVVVQPPSAQTLQRLADAGLPATPGRVLDLTMAGARYDVMKPVLDILLGAPEFDLVLAVVGSSARTQPQLAVQPIIDSAGHERPLAAMLVPDAPDALARLTAAGVPCFRSPEACADSIAAVFARRVPSLRLSRAMPSSWPQARPISEVRGYEVLDVLGVPHVPGVLLPSTGPVTELPFDYPVVAKLCSAAISHKTEVGGVVLNIADTTALATALDTLRSNLAAHAPAAEVDGVLVQPMRRGLAEVLVGYRVDADAGPIVMLAAGGIWAEVARDRSLRLAPVDLATAQAMIGEVKALRTLTGLRGRTKGDLDALAQAIVDLSTLAVRPELRVQEAEINPMMVMPEGEGVLAVDALVLAG